MQQELHVEYHSRIEATVSFIDVLEAAETPLSESAQNGKAR